MTDLDHEASRIAAGMSKAQREALRREVAYSLKVADFLMVNGFIRRFDHMHGFREHCLSKYTPLGLRVRAILSQDKYNG